MSCQMRLERDIMVYSYNIRSICKKAMRQIYERLTLMHVWFLFKNFPMIVALYA